MIEKGYAKTSYTDIANRSGCTRALVQYYFPKKDAFITDFVDQLLACVDNYASKAKLTCGSCFIDFSVTGFLYFQFLLKNEQLRPLALDLITHRGTSRISIERMASWQHRYKELAGIDDSVITDAVLMAVGGAHELIYHHLENNLEIDIRLLVGRTISTYIALLGLNVDEFNDQLKSHRVSEEAAKKANAKILQQMMSL